MVFDQSAINSEKMFYIQANVNQSSDHFVFDVTNGITWLRGLMLKIIIIPESLYIQTQNVSVDEGGSLQLRPTDMMPFSEYYRGKILEFKILQQPVFGQLKAGKSKVNRFTFKQLQTGQVLYYHDGSENSTDFIRFVAITRSKDSMPFDLWIDVVPVNDEVPQVVTNTGLQMWAGGRTIIRNTDLSKLLLKCIKSVVISVLYMLFNSGPRLRHWSLRAYLSYYTSYWWNGLSTRVLSSSYRQ